MFAINLDLLRTRSGTFVATNGRDSSKRKFRQSSTSLSWRTKLVFGYKEVGESKVEESVIRATGKSDFAHRFHELATKFRATSMSKSEANSTGFSP